MKTKHIKWIVLGFLGALLIAGYVGLRVIPSRGAQKELAEIAAAGLPLSGEDLNVYYQAVPEAENQARLIIEASQELVAAAKGSDPNRLGSVNAGESLSSELERAIDEYVKENETALQLLHKAAALPGSRYPVDFSSGMSTLLPHLARVKELTQLLRYDAVARSGDGDVAGALRSITTGLGVGGSLRNEPLLISELVRIACVAITLNGLERVLGEHQLTAEQIEPLSRKLAEEEASGPKCLVRSFVGERAIGTSAFRMNFQQIDQLGSGTGGGSGNDFLRSAGFQLYRASGLHQRDFAMYLEMMGRFATTAQRGFPEALDGFQRTDAEMQQRFSKGLGRFAILSRMLMPALTRAAEKEAKLSLRLRHAQVALAIEHFRIDHQGALPEALEELAPKYLFKVPVNPMQGDALEYERLPEKGYRLGPEPPPKKKGQSQESLAFTVLR